MRMIDYHLTILNQHQEKYKIILKLITDYDPKDLIHQIYYHSQYVALKYHLQEVLPQRFQITHDSPHNMDHNHQFTILSTKHRVFIVLYPTQDLNHHLLHLLVDQLSHHDLVM